VAILTNVFINAYPIQLEISCSSETIMVVYHNQEMFKAITSIILMV